jgi:TPR repeat protein
VCECRHVVPRGSWALTRPLYVTDVFDLAFVQVLRWYEAAAAADKLLALNNLGQLYYTGRGVVQSVDMAARLFEAAARRGSTGAMLNLAALLCGDHSSGGSNSRRALLTAKHWLSRAHDAGDARARRRLVRVLLSLRELRAAAPLLALDAGEAVRALMNADSPAHVSAGRVWAEAQIAEYLYAVAVVAEHHMEEGTAQGADAACETLVRAVERP